MLNKYFTKVFLINLDSRTDRLQKSKEVCDSVGLTFDRFSAISGDSLNEFVEYSDAYSKRIRWNKNTAGLVRTTIAIIEEAVQNNYENILIMEDDIDFKYNSKVYVEEFMKHLPRDWDMIYFGATHIEPYESYAPCIAKVTSANACHCYAINKHMYQTVLDILKPVTLPIDYLYRLMIHPRMNTYCVVPNIAYQFSGYSDLEGGYLDTSFIRKF